ncbi:MAG: ABC transporter substrate-binding protein [Firmicutes bacterium]|nr:ABC transporter substrate-binding protein [Bacillota bacterium]
MVKKGKLVRYLIIGALILLITGWYIEGQCIPGFAEEASRKFATVTDGTGKNVKVLCPVKRLVAITSAASEIIYALGEGDKIVGRDSYSVFPPSLLAIPVVAGSSYNPNLELILQARPDVVVADGMLKEDLRGKLEAAGIPVIIDSPSNPERVLPMVKYLGVLLGKEERAGEMVRFIERYENLVDDRVGRLSAKDKPFVFYEWSRPYFSAAKDTPAHNSLTKAGAINIAAQEPIKYPTLSAEWVAAKDPDIIVRMASRGETLEEMKALRDEVLARPGLRNVKAIKDKKVFITSWGVASGLRSVVGHLYWAKWFHPRLFADIDPEAVHREMLKKFYGLDLEGTWVYPQ